MTKKEFQCEALLRFAQGMSTYSGHIDHNLLEERVIRLTDIAEKLGCLASTSSQSMGPR